MNINVQPGEKCQAVVSIEVPAEKVTAERQEVIKQFARAVRVPGYRPGKVPRALVEKRFAADIRQELEKRLEDKAMQEARKKEGLQILAVLKEEVTANVDETYTLRVEVLLSPSFELPEYKGIPLALPKEEVLPEHVDKMIDRWKEQNANYEELEDGVLRMGLYAVVDYKATTKEGKPVAELVSTPMERYHFEREGAWFLMDESTFLPGFCGELLEHKKGDVVECDLTLPEDLAKEHLRGQEVHYTVTIKQVVEKKLPEFNDEGVAATMDGEFSTAEDFRQDITKRLEAEAKRYTEELLNRRVLEYLHGVVDFELPEMMVAQETQQHVNRIVTDSQRRGMAEEALIEKEGEIVEAASSMGRRDVKTKFLLNQIAQAENLTVTDQDILRRVQVMAAQANISLKKAVRILKGKGHMKSIAEEVLFGKALAFVKQNASVSVDEAQNALDLLWNEEGAA